LPAALFVSLKNLAFGASFAPEKPLLDHSVMQFIFKFFILSTNLLVVKMIRTQILSDNNNTICTKQ